MYTKDISGRLDSFAKKFGFASHKYEEGQIIFVRPSGEEHVIQEFDRGTELHKGWRELEEGILADDPKWAKAGRLPNIPGRVTLVYAAKRLAKAKPGTLDFAFWWWKILEKMKDLRDGNEDLAGRPASDARRVRRSRKDGP